ncbi:MAG: hypothetical protein ABI457_12105 [Hyphomicrobium sp.]
MTKQDEGRPAVVTTCKPAICHSAFNKSSIAIFDAHHERGDGRDVIVPTPKGESEQEKGEKDDETDLQPSLEHGSNLTASVAGRMMLAYRAD